MSKKYLLIMLLLCISLVNAIPRDYCIYLNASGTPDWWCVTNSTKNVTNYVYNTTTNNYTTVNNFTTINNYTTVNNFTTNETKYLKNFTVKDIGGQVTHTICLENTSCFNTTFTDSTGSNNYVTAISFSNDTGNITLNLDRDGLSSLNATFNFNSFLSYFNGYYINSSSAINVCSIYNETNYINSQISNVSLNMSNLNSSNWLNFAKYTDWYNTDQQVIALTSANISTIGRVTNLESVKLNTSQFLMGKYYNILYDCESVTAGYTMSPFVPTAISAGTGTLDNSNGSEMPGVCLLSGLTGAGSGFSMQISGATTYVLGSDYFFLSKIKMSSSNFSNNFTSQANITYARAGFVDVFTAGAVVDGLFFNITQMSPSEFVVYGQNVNNSVNNLTLTNYTVLNNTWYTYMIYVNSPLNVSYKIYDINNNLVWSEDKYGQVPTTIARATSSAVLTWHFGNFSATRPMMYIDYINVGVNKALNR